MLDRGNGGAFAADAGGETGVADRMGIRAQFDRRGQVHPAEHDAGIDRRGAQFEIDLEAGMKTDAGGADDGAKGALPDHGWNDS